jgi:threonine dehydrogenase-like Zn-dependent dehydrogenase
MKAGVYRGKERIEFEDVPDPEVGDHDILLRVSACGICGSDLHVYSAGWATDGMVLGHEYSGVVAAAGAKVTRHSVGDRLAVIPAVACRECLACKSGQTNLCEHPAGHAGGYAELVALSENVTAFRVPETTSMEAAAFLEPLSVAVRAVNRAALDPADAVVVVGLGSIGLSVLQVLRDRGVARLVAVDLSPGAWSWPAASGPTSCSTRSTATCRPGCGRCLASPRTAAMRPAGRGWSSSAAARGRWSGRPSPSWSRRAGRW